MKKIIAVLLTTIILTSFHTTAAAATVTVDNSDISALNLLVDDVEWICALDRYNDTYVGIRRRQWAGEGEKYIYIGYLLSMINGMGKVTQVESGKPAEGDVIVKLFDGTRYSYKMEGDGYSENNILNINGKRYEIGKKQAERFVSKLQGNIKRNQFASAFPKWLVPINSSDVAKIDRHQPLIPNYSKWHEDEFDEEDSIEDELKFMTSYLYDSYFDIEKGERYKLGGFNRPNDKEYYELTLTLKSGVIYKFKSLGNILCVESSNMKYGIKYTLEAKSDSACKTVREAFDALTTWEPNPPL